MATISEVAKLAGVSVKTVSRVMNNYEHISPKTRGKVEEALRQLSYAQTSWGQQLRRSESVSIGMLYGDPSSGYQARLNHSVLNACSDAGCYLAVELFREKDQEWERQVTDFLERTQVKNMILVPPMCDSTEIHDLLCDKGVNFVVISPSAPVPGATSVAMNDRRAAREIVNYIISLGHKKIAHISGRDQHIATYLRREGYEQALKHAGIPFREDYVEAGDFKFKPALASAEKLLKLEDPPTAIFAANDEMAAAVVMAANKLGLRVPQDFSVVGFDDTPIAETLWPDLTTVAQPFDEMAGAAIAALKSGHDTDSAVSETLVLKHKIILRGSTGPCPPPVVST